MRFRHLVQRPGAQANLDTQESSPSRRLQTIAKGYVDLDTEDGKATTEPDRAQQLAGPLSWMTETLQEDVKQVPVVLTADHLTDLHRRTSHTEPDQ